MTQHAAAAGESGRAGFTRWLEILANAGTLLVALLVSAVLVKPYLLAGSGMPASAPSQSPPSIRPEDLLTTGTNLGKRLPEIEFNKNGRTLVLVLSTHSPSCTESAPFYRQVMQAATAGPGVKLIGVFPEPVAEAASYLAGESIQVDQVKQIPLHETGVVGTPTLILVNRGGIVIKTWVGKLADERQRELLSVISRHGPGSPPPQSAKPSF